MDFRVGLQDKDKPYDSEEAATIDVEDLWAVQGPVRVDWLPQGVRAYLPVRVYGRQPGHGQRDQRELPLREAPVGQQFNGADEQEPVPAYLLDPALPLGPEQALFEEHQDRS